MRGRGREEVRERGAIIKAESWRAFEERKTWASHHITSYDITQRNKHRYRKSMRYQRIIPVITAEKSDKICPTKSSTHVRYS